MLVKKILHGNPSGLINVGSTSLSTAKEKVREENIDINRKNRRYFK